MTRVKICGITDEAGVEAAVRAGADAIISYHAKDAAVWLRAEDST